MFGLACTDALSTPRPVSLQGIAPPSSLQSTIARPPPDEPDPDPLAEPELPLEPESEPDSPELPLSELLPVDDVALELLLAVEPLLPVLALLELLDEELEVVDVAVLEDELLTPVLPAILPVWVPVLEPELEALEPLQPARTTRASTDKPAIFKYELL